MARPITRHRMRRIRTTARNKVTTRIENGPAKIKARAHRDAHMAAAIKAAKGSRDLNPAVQSWVCRKLDKQWRQVTAGDLKTLAV